MPHNAFHNAKEYLESIPEDEPVFILRAQDAASISTLDAYRGYCNQLGSPQEHTDGVWKVRADFREWQLENPPKIPD